MAAVAVLAMESRPAAAPVRSKRQIHAATARAIETWAAQKRLLFTSIEGFAPRSIIEKLRREREGAGEGRRFSQRWPEVYTGDGAIVQRVVQELPELPRMVATCYYLFTGPWFWAAGDQAQAIGVSKTDYWTELRVAESAIETGLRLLQKLPEDARSSRAEV